MPAASSQTDARARFTGAITALVTPFKAGAVDFDRLRQQVRAQIDAGIAGLVPVGTTGESPTLSMDEHRRVIEAVVREAREAAPASTSARARVPVIAGAGANSTAEAIELHGFAREVGADAALSVNPYYNKPTQEGLYRHFMTLSEKVDLPIVLYNIPGRTGVTMSPQTIARLAREANIAAIKEATGDVAFASAVMAECDLPVLSGDDPLTLPLLSLGAVGVVSVVSNLLPARVAELCRLGMEGRFTEARRIHFELLGLTRALFLDGNPAGVKQAMKRLGRDSGEVRLPLVEVSQETARVIEEEMRRLEVVGG